MTIEQQVSDSPFPEQAVAKEHSKWGIASFTIALLSWVAAFGLILLSCAINTLKPGTLENQNDPLTMIIGGLYFLIMLISLTGLAVSLPGIISDETKRLFGILGMSLNVVTLLIEMSVCELAD